jgi:hypothetical protein
MDLDGSGGPSSDDFVVIVFLEGHYDGYFDYGYLGGGNFQVKP